MKVTVIGAGYVGLVTGACLADIGNDVVCLDIDFAKIEFLNAGGVPIYEPGLQELLKANCHAGRLRFTSDADVAIQHGDMVFIATSTPADEDGRADLKNVLAAAQSIGARMTGFKVVVNKSTVPVGSAEKVHALLDAALQARGFAADHEEREENDQPTFAVLSNPEFLKEGAAVADFMRPDRIVIGSTPDAVGRRALTLLRQLYAPFNRNRERTLCMDLRSAEFTKYAANAMLATRISFMNELANLADKVGVDIERVRQGIGSDPRIGFGFLYAGTGYGGSCFPKDVQALIHTADDCGQPLKVLQAVQATNQEQKCILLEKIEAYFGSELQGQTFAMWGLAFKPNTDDMREAPSRVLIRALIERGALVQLHDPVAMERAQQVLALDLADLAEGSQQVTFIPQALDALTGADALIVMTEWKAYRSPDFAIIKQALRHPVIFDGRNLYEPEDVSAAGMQYVGVGRRSFLVPERKDL